MKKMRKGFTLVELLIVIAIIAVLAAMMTLSSTDATITANAARIGNGFKVLASAFAEYHADSGDDSSVTYFGNHSSDYLGAPIKGLGSYSIDHTGGRWYLAYEFGSSNTQLASKFYTFSKDLSMTGTTTKARMKIY